MQTHKNISIIVAIDLNNSIGRDNKLMWHISEDFKRFKKITMGNPVIMGEKTFHSLPVKPLPGRKNIVLSDDLSFRYDGCIVVNSFESAIGAMDDEKENFIIGGEMIYKLFLPYANKIYLTKVLHTFDATAFFPDVDFSKYKIEEESDVFFDEKSNLKYKFIIYKIESPLKSMP